MALTVFLVVFCSCGQNATEAEISNSHAEPAEQTILAAHTPEPDAVAGKEVVCNEAKENERRLCDVADPEWKGNGPDHVSFRITYTAADLNNDGTDELIVWESSWAGTSGGILLIIEQSGSGFRTLYKDGQTWSPVLVLDSKHFGWNDVAYLRAGGGAESEFVVVKYSKNRYSVAATSETQPTGRVVIGKNWYMSTFGPTGN